MPTSIGELNERSLHRAIKRRYAIPGSVTEQAIDGFVADVVIGDRIIEVQTGIFQPLKKKLPRLLERHRVTLVHPIAMDRYLIKLSDDPDAPATRRKSPRHGSIFHVFSALVSIAALLEHPNLELDVVMTVEEDVRVWNPKGNRRRGAWTTVDRRLLEVVKTHPIATMADLFAMLDSRLPEQFTTRDIAAATRLSRRLGQQAAFCFRESGISEICGKAGNSLIYRRAAPPRRR